MTIDALFTDDGNADDSGNAPDRVGVVKSGLTWLFRDAGGASPGLTDFVASTGSIDRQSDVVDQQTWRLGNFRANPVILYEHAVPVVGRAERISRTKGEDGKFSDLRISVRWDDGAHNPVGQLVAEQHRNGFRKAVSVGFIPGQVISRTDLPEGDALRVTGADRWSAGFVFRHPELLEVSSVAVPANRDALQLSVDILNSDDPIGGCIKFVRGVTSNSIGDNVIEAIRHDHRVRRAIQAMILETAAPRQVHTNSLSALWGK